MLDPKIIRQSFDFVLEKTRQRGAELNAKEFNALEEKRKQLQVHIQDLQNERNVRSKEVGIAKQAGKNIDDIKKQLKELSDTLKSKEEEFLSIQTSLDEFLATIPNLINETVPLGKSEEDNKLIRIWGEPKSFSFTPKDHIALGSQQNFMDFETAAKLSGARFVVLKGPLARMQRALAQFMMDVHIKEHGYEEISVPYIVNAECLFGTGQLPKFKEDLFEIKGDHERYLISTAEVPVTNTVRDEIVEEKNLPLQYVCYSACFRSEAGSYGKDVRGMIRQHQFEKVELVHIVKPEESYKTLELLTTHAEKILQLLELPYRVMALCSADIGFASAKTYDIEVWLPGQNKYREISSCSNMESFQARRMKARYRDENGKIEFVHTLNGSGLAIGRTLVAILENYQDELGRIHVPKVLQPYMHGLSIIENT